MERSIVGTRYIEIKNRVSQADRKRNREDILEQKLACDLRARSRRGQGFVDGVCARFGGYSDIRLARFDSRRRIVEIDDKLVWPINCDAG